jgi:hypothetical protein
MADTASTVAIAAGAAAIVGALLYDSNDRPYYVRNNHRYYVTQPEEQYYRVHHHGVVRKAYVPEQEYPVARDPYHGNNRQPRSSARSPLTQSPSAVSAAVGNTSHCRITRTIQSPARLIQHALGISRALRRRVDSVTVCAGNNPVFAASLIARLRMPNSVTVDGQYSHDYCDCS